MRRREFIMLLSGGAAWPLTARAQQPERMRRIGVLMGLPANDPVGQSEVAGLQRGLRKLGWIVGVTCKLSTAGLVPILTAFKLSQNSWSRCGQT